MTSIHPSGLGLQWSVQQLEMLKELGDFVILLNSQIKKKCFTCRINVMGVSPMAWASPRFVFIKLVNDLSAPEASSLNTLDISSIVC